jgi:nitronate monooxygenase
MLALGAAGVAVGTRFLLTPESKYSDKQKCLLLGAKSEDTVRSFAYDVARGTLGWPEGIDGRALRTKVFDTYNEGRGSEEVKRVYEDGAKRGDPAGYVTWSGTSIGLIRETKPADVSDLTCVVVKELTASAIRKL